MSEVLINLVDSQPSLCIPRVFENITETRIRRTFDNLQIGEISRIDIKERKNERGERYKRVYIHFNKWYWNKYAQTTRAKLVSGKEIKIVYDNPWFWKVSASKWVEKTPSIAPALSNIVPPLSNIVPPLSNIVPPLSNIAPPLSNIAPLLPIASIAPVINQNIEDEWLSVCTDMSCKEEEVKEEDVIAPNNSPIDETFDIEYGNVSVPKKRNLIVKKKEKDDLYDDVI